MASYPGETSHAGSPTGLVSTPEFLNIFHGFKKQSKNRKPRSRNGRSAHNKSWIDFPTFFLPMCPPYSVCPALLCRSQRFHWNQWSMSSKCVIPADIPCFKSTQSLPASLKHPRPTNVPTLNINPNHHVNVSSVGHASTSSLVL